MALAGLLAFGWPAALAARDFVFVAWNVENFALAPAASGERQPKPPASVEAVVRTILALRADAVGFAEMGSAEDLAELQRRLRAAGRDFPYSELVAAADEERRLALLSRVPIVARASVTESSYELRGGKVRVKRGFLDVTLEPAPGARLRLVGAHLKSRLARGPGGADEALARRQEAALLRAHLNAVFAAEGPDAEVLAWGDFNDAKNSPGVLDILGPPGAVGALHDLAPADRLGDRWTHHFAPTDSYERIDYLLASRALRPRVVAARTKVHRDPDWREASDHRPVAVALRYEHPRLAR